MVIHATANVKVLAARRNSVSEPIWPPTRGPSLRNHALAEIRRAIVRGELAEHATYSAAGLAKQLGISLSPVREAMMHLVSEGTVEAVPNRGYRLVPVTEDDLQEIVRIRLLLAVPASESLCRADAGERKTAAARLAPLAERAIARATDGDRDGFMAADREFHEELLLLGLGPRAKAIGIRLRDQSRAGEAGRESPGVNLRSARELETLASLIRSGDAVAAAGVLDDNLHYYERVLGDGARNQTGDTP